MTFADLVERHGGKKFMNDLREEAGVCMPTVYRALRNPDTLKVQTVKKLMKGLNSMGLPASAELFFSKGEQ